MAKGNKMNAQRKARAAEKRKNELRQAKANGQSSSSSRKRGKP